MTTTNRVKIACAVIAFSTLLGCTQPQEVGDGAGVAVNRTSGGLGDAAITPLDDFNLRREEIPEVLSALNSPYEPIADPSCEGIAALVTQLDVVLGLDADVRTDDDDRLTVKAGGAAADAALDAVSSTTTGFIPFRGLLRQASGASAYEKRLRSAYDRGLRRRAYLKGVGGAQGCLPPAAPYPYFEEPTASVPEDTSD